MAIPSNHECETYYLMWRKGKSNTEIATSLGFSDVRMKEHLPYFLHFSRIRYKEDYREGLAAGHPPQMELTEDRKRQFLQLTVAGMDYIQISKIMNIPLPTIMDVWFKEDPIFKDQVVTATDLATARVTQALYKKAIGYHGTVKTVTRTKGTGEKGLPVNTVTVSKQERIVDGDFQAQKFWLINKAPKLFSADGFVNVEGNKGSIMKQIENSVNEGDVAAEDAKFNEEQRLIEASERK